MNSIDLIKKTALETVKVERDTLSELEDSIDDNFCAAVQDIYNSKGRVIVTGLGKSAIIAQKIVATLNSTGTASVFMHAADAVHGDLGMVQQEDIVLFISKSGDTSEIKVILQLLENSDNILIGISANKQSFLARKVNYLLYTPVSKEADPNNLAPTASTTAQMVMGDALAMALLSLRGFSPKDFAQFHPGGTLGKQLYLRVKDLVVNNEKPMVYLEADLQTVILEMTSKRLGATAVCDQENNLCGVVTDGDLRRMLEKKSVVDTITANDIMSKHPITIHPDDLAVKALAKMRSKSITQLIVLEDGKYKGMIHLHDLIREGLI